LLLTNEFVAVWIIFNGPTKGHELDLDVVSRKLGYRGKIGVRGAMGVLLKHTFRT